MPYNNDEKQLIRQVMSSNLTLITEIGGFEHGRFKVRVEPTKRELGAASSHVVIGRWRLDQMECMCV